MLIEELLPVISFHNPRVRILESTTMKENYYGTAASVPYKFLKYHIFSLRACSGEFEILIKSESDMSTTREAVSREAVLDLCDKRIKYDIPYEYYEDKKHIRGWDEGRIINMTKLMQLPPVTPKPKTGHWIETDAEDAGGELYSYWACSECGRRVGFNLANIEDVLEEYPYCHCGAEMEATE